MLFKLLDVIFKKMGYVRTENLIVSGYKYNSLRAKHVALHREVLALSDENNSLWDMLEEMKESSKLMPQDAKSILENLQHALTEEMMKNFISVGDA